MRRPIKIIGMVVSAMVQLEAAVVVRNPVKALGVVRFCRAKRGRAREPINKAFLESGNHKPPHKASTLHHA